MKNTTYIITAVSLIALLGAESARAIDAGALPKDGIVKYGKANIVTKGRVMNVNQSTSRADIDWKSFDIGKSAKVNFNQLDSNSITINRVVGSSPSVIEGMMSAKGRVVILNDSGLTITKTGQINVGSLIASTAKNIESDDISVKLTDFGKGEIVNEGKVQVKDGGRLIFVAEDINNKGSLIADNGAVVLSSAKTFTDGKFTYHTKNEYRGNSSVSTEENDLADEGSGITNTGTISSKNGSVLVSTDSIKNGDPVNSKGNYVAGWVTDAQLADLKSTVINLDGVVDATDITVGAAGDFNSKANYKNTMLVARVADNANIKANLNKATIISTQGDLTYEGTINNASNSGVTLRSENNLSFKGSVNKGLIDFQAKNNVNLDGKFVGIHNESKFDHSYLASSKVVGKNINISNNTSFSEFGPLYIQSSEDIKFDENATKSNFKSIQRLYLEAGGDITTKNNIDVRGATITAKNLNAANITTSSTYGMLDVNVTGNLDVGNISGNTIKITSNGYTNVKDTLTTDSLKVNSQGNINMGKVDLKRSYYGKGAVDIKSEAGLNIGKVTVTTAAKPKNESATYSEAKISLNAVDNINTGDVIIDDGKVGSITINSSEGKVVTGKLSAKTVSKSEI